MISYANSTRSWKMTKGYLLRFGENVLPETKGKTLEEMNNLWKRRKGNALMRFSDRKIASQSNVYFYEEGP